MSGYTQGSRAEIALACANCSRMVDKPSMVALASIANLTKVYAGQKQRFFVEPLFLSFWESVPGTKIKVYAGQKKRKDSTAGKQVQRTWARADTALRLQREDR